MVAHGVSGAPWRVDIHSPGRGDRDNAESLPPLRGSDNHGLPLGPTAYAVGYSLAALRACISGHQDVHRYWRC